MMAAPLRRRLLTLRAVALLALAPAGAGCGDAETQGDPTGGAGGVASTSSAGGMGSAGGAMAGVGGGGGQGGAPVAAPVPDFSLLDVNPASPTADQPVSPRDYLMRVSAWYFGHAT